MQHIQEAILTRKKIIKVNKVLKLTNNFLQAERSEALSGGAVL